MNRRGFLKLGALFVPAVALVEEPQRAYSFIRRPQLWVTSLDDRRRVHVYSAGQVEVRINGIVPPWLSPLAVEIQ